MGRAAITGIVVGWRRRAVLLAALAVGIIGILAASAPAGAHDHQIPQTVLKKGARDLQAGTKVYESAWTRPSGNLCEHQSTFYKTRFPEKDTVRAGSKLRVRISKSHRPDSFEVAAYRGLDENGEPAGEATLLKTTLERVVKGDKTVAWDAIFFVNEPARDYYLVGEGHWREREGCGGDQFAFWGFHIGTGA